MMIRGSWVGSWSIQGCDIREFDACDIWFGFFSSRRKNWVDGSVNQFIKKKYGLWDKCLIMPCNDDITVHSIEQISVRSTQ